MLIFLTLLDNYGTAASQTSKKLKQIWDTTAPLFKVKF